MTTPGAGTLFPAPGPALAGPHLDPGATEVILFEGQILAPVGAVPGPATTVTGPDAFGDPAVVGTDTTYAREDHDHGLPAAPAVTSPLTGAGGTGDATGGAVTFASAAGAAGGAARLAGGHANGHNDRIGGEVNAEPGTAFEGAAEIRCGSTGTPHAGANFVRVEGNDTDAVRIVSGAGVVFIPNLPTSDPGVSGRLWVDSGVLMVSP